MKIKAMYMFKGMNEFNTVTQFIEQEDWKIEKQLLKERVETYMDTYYFVMLKNRFLEAKLSIWELKNEEVITWIDTLLLMRKLMIELFKRGINAEEIQIIMEYPLVHGNYMRSDYLILYHRLIIVLEFGMFNQDEKRSEERYTKKLQESINYRQIIANMVDKQIQVVNYVMIYLPEYNKKTKELLKENINHNHNELGLLANFIDHFIKIQDTLSAIHQLEGLYK